MNTALSVKHVSDVFFRNNLASLHEIDCIHFTDDLRIVSGAALISEHAPKKGL